MVEATGFLPQRQMVEGSGFAAPFRTLKRARCTSALLHRSDAKAKCLAQNGRSEINQLRAVRRPSFDPSQRNREHNQSNHETHERSADPKRPQNGS
jgi:hypothetical protein